MHESISKIHIQISLTKCSPVQICPCTYQHLCRKLRRLINKTACNGYLQQITKYSSLSLTASFRGIFYSLKNDSCSILQISEDQDFDIRETEAAKNMKGCGVSLEMMSVYLSGVTLIQDLHAKVNQITQKLTFCPINVLKIEKVFNEFTILSNREFYKYNVKRISKNKLNVYVQLERMTKPAYVYAYMKVDSPIFEKTIKFKIDFRKDLGSWVDIKFENSSNHIRSSSDLSQTVKLPENMVSIKNILYVSKYMGMIVGLILFLIAPCYDAYF